GFTNKEFQVGAYSNQTIRASIGATSSDKIGHVRTESYGVDVFSASTGNLALTFTVGNKKVSLESVTISTSAGTGLGVVAEAINRYSDELGGVRAEYTVETAGTAAVTAGNIVSLSINGVKIGDILDIKTNDKDNRLVQAINAYKDTTGVQASIDKDGALRLTSTDGRAINVTGDGVSGVTNFGTGVNVGTLNLTQLGANDIKVSGTNTGGQFTVNSASVAQAVTTLRQLKGSFNGDTLKSIGVTTTAIGTALDATFGSGVTTLKGAMLTMDIAESAIKQLDSIRSDLGSVQQQMQSTINNITITQVNVKSAESGIREVDFASESANYSNLNILAQAGSYAMSQANSVQQNILRLLQ
ncbi:flagellin, partial [Helicobacter sp. MIT 05-5294]|uniref:flagellin n=1 Tax=Helicobacter sp. MIT 05-5294 TaxID=1548150 RepID=UPI0010FD8C40